MRSISRCMLVKSEARSVTGCHAVTSRNGFHFMSVMGISPFVIVDLRMYLLRPMFNQTSCHILSTRNEQFEMVVIARLDDLSEEGNFAKKIRQAVKILTVKQGGSDKMLGVGSWLLVVGNWSLVN